MFFKKFFIIFTILVNTFLYGGFLMPNEAFKPYANVDSDMNIVAGIDIGDGIYLYEDKVDLKIKDKDIYIKDIKKPIATEHHGEKVFLTSPKFLIKLDKKTDKDIKKDVVVEISYQGCSDAGLCYEPFIKEFKVNIDTSKIRSSLIKKDDINEQSKTDAIAQTLMDGNLFLILGTFFIFGLLLSFTPCVFPMIPIISGLIISQGKGITIKKAFLLSVIYVLAMAIAYTFAGVLAGLFGSNLQATLQNPFVVYSFSAIFVALAFSMFGFYELKLPHKVVSKVSKNSNKSGVLGVAIMGFLSALIVGPCVAAPLAGALVYIGQTGDALLGGMALFVMSIGMGIPLIFVGVSAGKFMPKPGAWMTIVNTTFGVMMLGVAIWMLEKVLSLDIIMLLYSLLGIGFSIYLGVFETKVHVFRKFLAVVTFIYSLALFIGFLAGNVSFQKPLSFFKSSSVYESVKQIDNLNFKVVKSLDELNLFLEENRGKKILLDFSAKWCSACKELEEITFKDKVVRDALKDYVLIRADVTENSLEQKALSKKYGVFGPPAIIFFDKNLKVLKSKTIIGFVDVDEFLTHL